MLATPQIWVENFRMGKDCFLYLCDKLRPIIVRQDTRFRRPISVEQRVAITLWCHVTCCGISRSSVCVIVHDTCHAIVCTLLIHYILNIGTP